MIPLGAMLILPPIDSGIRTLANFERGVYEPSNDARDGMRVFDGSEEEEDVEGSRLPLLIVLALLVLAMFAGVVWLAPATMICRLTLTFVLANISRVGLQLPRGRSSWARRWRSSR